MEAILRFSKRIGTKVLDRVLNTSLGFLVRDFYQELDRRNAQRSANSGQWLMPEEAAIAEALGKVIIPSDEDSPGMDEVCVLGPSPITSLDKMIRNGSYRQEVYARGLLSFDVWSLRKHGRKFVELSTEQQANLFRAAQEINESQEANPSVITKLWRRFGAPFTEVRSGTLYAAVLYPIIRADCLEIFYTSRVSWAWLEYDGPPMEKGYSDLIRPRLGTSSSMAVALQHRSDSVHKDSTNRSTI